MTTNPINNISEYHLSSLTNQMAGLVSLPLTVLLKVLSCLTKQDTANLGQACQFTASVLSPNPQLADLQTKHQDYLVRLLAIVKSNADKLSPVVFQLFRTWGMTDQATLFECAKCAASNNPYFVAREIKEFGITDQNYLFELAKILAQNYHGFSEHIQNFGITDPEMLFEVAKIAAAKDGVGLWQNIQNYKITNEDKLFKILKIVVAECSHATKYLKNLGIIDPHRRFELFKIAARNEFSSECLIEHMENYEITETWMLVEIAKILASKLEPFSNRKLEDLFKLIKKAGITDQNDLFEILKVAVTKDPRTISESFRSFGITTESMRFELAKIAATKDPAMLSQQIANYKITDQDSLFELAKIVAVKDPVALSKHIGNYQIKDQNRRFQLAKLAVYQENWSFCQRWDFVKGYGIIEPVWLFELAKIVVFRGQYRDWQEVRKSFRSPIHRQALALLAFNQVANRAQLSDDFLFSGELTELNFDIASKAAKNHVLNFQDIKILTIPLDFESEEEKKKTSQKLQDSFNEWKAFAKEFGIPDQVLHSLEEAIFKGRDSLQQQKKDLLWLYALPIVTTESPLYDETMTPLLLSIVKITDPFTRVAATDALLTISSSSEKKELLKDLLVNRKEYLYLVVLMTTASGFPKQAILELLDELAPNIYQDSKTIGSINEMLAALQKSTTLSTLKKQVLINLIFNTPTQGPREPKPKYTARLTLHRQNQYHWTTAVHSMLNFEQDNLLTEVKAPEELVSKWETFICEAFSVPTELLPKFLETFSQSKRYPDGLIIYGTRLQSLSENEKALVRPPLGKIANSILSGDYPQVRYDFAENIHLKTVFTDNPSLLEAWKTPVTVQIKRTADEAEKKATPQQLVQRLTRQALCDNHLGKDQESKYPELVDLLTGSPFTSLTSTGDEQEQKRVEIVNRCAKLLNPQSDLSEIKKSLTALLELVPADVQFHRDVNDILIQLSTPQVSVSREGWTIEDTDAWEDIELMGTEVHNSCQHIKGNPQLNKCVISAILDGKIRLMVARDASGKIIGRAILRVLWNAKERKPVLFVDRIYTRGRNHEILQHDILEGCRQKTEAMGLTLTASSRDFSHLFIQKYPEPLKSLGGPSPYEYVDAIGAIKEKGVYSIPDSRVVWNPPVKMQTSTPLGERTLTQTTSSELECF